jgi:hypothetical protein
VTSLVVRHRLRHVLRASHQGFFGRIATNRHECANHICHSLTLISSVTGSDADRAEESTGAGSRDRESESKIPVVE